MHKRWALGLAFLLLIPIFLLISLSVHLDGFAGQIQGLCSLADLFHGPPEERHLHARSAADAGDRRAQDSGEDG